MTPHLARASRHARPSCFAQRWTDLVTALAVAAAALAAEPAQAQTIRPLVGEYQTKAAGRIELVNDGDRPLTVVVEPRGFSVDAAGEIRDEPLPATVHVRLSAMTLRVPARQTRYVFYEAEADTAPAWFVLYAVFSGYPSRDFHGLSVQLELPHLVYLLPRERWKADDVSVTAELDRARNVLVVDVRNQGTLFGRISELELDGGRASTRVPGFALFPGGLRRLEVPWKVEEHPRAVKLKSSAFSVERPLSAIAR